MSPVTDLVHGVFAAYRTADRAAIERLLAADFTFTSPYDDHIDRATYFERCWPHAGSFAYHDLQQLTVFGTDCFVLYEAKLKADGKMVRNTELFRTDGTVIHSVEVFFGRPTPAG